MKTEIVSLKLFPFCFDTQKGEGHSNKKYYKVHDREEVSECFNSFIEGDLDIRDKYVKKLIIIRATMEASQFFKSHEVTKI